VPPVYGKREALRSDGVAGNARITGGAAALLLALLALEGATIPFIGPLAGPHIFIGMLLIPPVLLKLASTGYRFARYYSGSPPYRRKGPPPLPMRLLAPIVVATTAALFASGLWLLVEGPRNNTVVFLHKASFIAWFVTMSVHVLGHLLELPRLALPDWRRAGGREAALAGSSLRMTLLATSVIAGVGLALATLSLLAPWLSSQLGG
jgi:hypothetical protein